MKLDKKITIGKLIADGDAYDRNKIFRFLAVDNNEIQCCIKVRKNSKLDGKRKH